MFLNKTKKSIQLIADRAIETNVSCNQNAIANDCELFIGEIIKGVEKEGSILPIHPGFELHPYKGILQNFNATKYIIGTFPPISYLIDSIRKRNVVLSRLKQPTAPYQFIDEPQIPFFHGNVSGLWGALFNEKDLSELKRVRESNRNEAQTFLINWLNENDIYYDDIILYTQRKLSKLKPSSNMGYTFEDVNLLNICPDINLIQKVLNHPTLNVICFTNGMTFRTSGLGISKNGLVDTKNSDALSLFLRACQNLGLQIEMQCLPHFEWITLSNLSEFQKKTKLIFELRFTKTKQCREHQLADFTQKSITILTPYSPAAHGTIETHPIVLALQHYYGLNNSSQKLLLIIYEKFRNNSFLDLYKFNIQN